MRKLETDYLVVGAGASGMAFTDTLTEHCDADVLLVDRRARPGGHWNDAYSFIRLHLPSAYYGVNSRSLGGDRVDRHGANVGLYERASAGEICDYFGRVLDEQLLPSGRVRFMGMHDFVPEPSLQYRLVSRLSGQEYAVTVRRKLVDATYLEAQVPATHTPSFSVAPGVRMIPVNALVHVPQAASRYVLIGGGKTSIDACLWLLDNGVPAECIRWVRPRDPWLLDRASWQPLDQVASIMEGLAADLEAMAQAASAEDLFLRLEAAGRVLRIDPEVVPTMYHGGSVSRDELIRLRQVRDVVRLGHVLRLDPDEMVLAEGTAPGDRQDIYVDCSARGLGPAPARPIFEADRITIQQVRTGSPCFNAALLGYVEATRDDLAEQNLLCPPSPYPDSPKDWIDNLRVTLLAAKAWRDAPDLLRWIEDSRLDLMRGATGQADEPRMQQAYMLRSTSLKPALARIEQLAGSTEPLSASQSVPA